MLTLYELPVEQVEATIQHIETYGFMDSIETELLAKSKRSSEIAAA